MTRNSAWDAFCERTANYRNPGKKHVNEENGSHTTLRLSHRVLPTGEAAVEIGGELDVGAVDTACRYVQEVINRHGGPVVVSLAAVQFCDVPGLGALVRMANYAEQADCPFIVTSPSPMLIKLMRITGLDRKFLSSYLNLTQFFFSRTEHATQRGQPPSN
jgi:anti-sigma B factor antagonist